MKRILALICLSCPLLVLSSWADPIEGPETPCDAPQIEWSYDTLCQSTEEYTLSERLTYIPSMVGDTTVYDSIKRPGTTCDSLVIIHEIHVRPSYVMPLNVVIPIGYTSAWCGYHGGWECTEGIYIDSIWTLDGCDSIMIYYVTTEPTDGYCGAEGDGSNLRWFYDSDNYSLTITGSGRMADYDFEGPWPSRINRITLPNGLTSIGANAFNNCRPISAIDIPESVNHIGDAAFRYSSLEWVVCHAVTPPTLDDFPFNLSQGTLKVPVASLETYRANSGYAISFSRIVGLTSSVEEVTSSSVSIQWLANPDVMQYNVGVYKAQDTIAYYEIDGEGQILSSQRFVMDIHHLRKDTTISTSDYFVLTVDDLEAGTDYNYEISGTSSNNAIVYYESGEFTTEEDKEGLFDPFVNETRRSRKILRNGQLFILRDGKTYNALGAEVR